MTVRVPRENAFDKILKHFGKHRHIVIPEGIDRIYVEKGPYVQIMAKREGFIRSLFGKEI